MLIGLRIPRALPKAAVELKDWPLGVQWEEGCPVKLSLFHPDVYVAQSDKPNEKTFGGSR